MAGISKLKLAVETGEWDAGLKKAMQAMNNFTRDAGSIEQALRKDSDAMSKFAQMMGNMDTASKAPRQALREVTNTILELQATYKSLSDADKSSDFGKNLQATIDKLKQKAGGLKDQMADLEEEIKHLASDTSLSDSMNMMTRTVGSCASAIVAWTDGGKEMDAVIKNLAKIQTTVAAVEALTKAFQAQNLVLLANPYVLLGTAILGGAAALAQLTKNTNEAAEAGQKIIDKCGDEYAEVEALNHIVHDSSIAYETRKQALEKLQSIVPSYHATLTEEGNLLNDNISALDDYKRKVVEAAQAEALKEEIKEEVKAMEKEKVQLQELKKKLAEVETQDGANAISTTALRTAINNLESSIEDHKTKIDKITDAWGDATSAVQDYMNNASMIGAGNGAGLISEKGAGIGAGLLGVVNGAKGKGGSGKRGGGGRRGGGSTKKDTYVPVEGSIDAMQDKVKELNKQFNATADQGVRDNLKSQIEECNKQLDIMRGKVEEVKPEEMVQGLSLDSKAGLSAFKSDQNSIANTSTIGSEDYNMAVALSLDATTMENMLPLIEQYTPQLAEAFKNTWLEEMANGLDIPDEAWEEMETAINEKLAELELDPIKIDVKTGNLEKADKQVKKTTDNVAGATAAFTAMGNALDKIDDPGTKIAGYIATAIGQVLASYGSATAQAAEMGPWAWIAFAATGLATVLTTVASIKSAASGYADGGIIKGGSFAGDATPIMANAGEVVLNASMQRNLAGQLESNASGGGGGSSTISGEQIVTVVNAYGRRTGRGEILR